MSMHMSIYTFIYMCMHMSKNMSMHTSMHTSIYMSIYMPIPQGLILKLSPHSVPNLEKLMAQLSGHIQSKLSRSTAWTYSPHSLLNIRSPTHCLTYGPLPPSTRSPAA